MVFLPSIRKGSLRVERSNQPNSVQPRFTSLPQSLMRPLTRKTLAPPTTDSTMLAGGVSRGLKRKHSRPARGAQDVASPPAFPAEGRAVGCGGDRLVR